MDPAITPSTTWLAVGSSVFVGAISVTIESTSVAMSSDGSTAGGQDYSYCGNEQSGTKQVVIHGFSFFQYE